MINFVANESKNFKYSQIDEIKVNKNMKRQEIFIQKFQGGREGSKKILFN